MNLVNLNKNDAHHDEMNIKVLITPWSGMEPPNFSLDLDLGN